MRPAWKKGVPVYEISPRSQEILEWSGLVIGKTDF